MLPSSHHYTALRASQQHRQDSSPPIARDLPFGITTIVGGTNLRFSLSAPFQNSSIDTAISWQDLLRDSSLTNTAENLANIKGSAFKDIGRRFVSFIEANAENDAKGPPFSQLHTLIFSVAGIVDGNLVSLTNVPLGIVREDLASEIVCAINQELTQRGFERCDPKVIAVVNDAVAGLMGELKAGGLQGVKNGGFIILGTGMGGICCINGAPCVALDEMGHRLLVNARERSVRILVGDELAPFLTERNEFVALQGEESYAEHHLAGPWVATRFVKAVSDLGDMVVGSLSRTLANSHGLSDEHFRRGLAEIQRLPSHELHLWGQRAPSDIVRCVNQFIFTPEAADVINARRKLQSGALSAAETLATTGYQSWRGYFELLGRCGGAIGGALKKMGHPMERLVLGGGIGEACNHYSQIWKKHAYGVLHSSAALSPGSIIFSPMRAEERENAIASASIREAIDPRVYH